MTYLLLIIQILCTIGFFLSLYALIVRLKARNISYKPVCDINDNISCTKAFTSDYAKIILVPNPVIGIFYYVFMFYLSLVGHARLLSYFSIIAFCASLFLAYVSYVKQKNFCVVCSATYVTNLFILIFSFLL